MLSRGELERSIDDPNFGGYRILTDAINLVLHSRKPWPGNALGEQPTIGWNCQAAGWDATEAINNKAVKIMLAIDREPQSGELGFVFLRMARLVFDDLSSNPAAFDCDSDEIADWFESAHGHDIYDDRVRLGYRGFFVSDEPGECSFPSAWVKPNYLLVQVRQIGVDPSFGNRRVLRTWNLMDSLDTWRQVGVADLDLDLFAKRLEKQAKSFTNVVTHLDSLTWIHGSKGLIPQTEW